MRCDGNSIRFLNKNSNVQYRAQIQKWINELIALYGTKIKYYRYNYRTERHDYLYGEDPAAQYSDPVEMIAIATLNQDAMMLTKFGVQTTAELQCYIPFDTFADAMGGDRKAFPRAQDIIELTELGMDRPGGGGYPYFYAGTSACTSGDADSINAIACDPTDGSLSNDFVPSDCNPVSSWMRGPCLYEVTEYRDENVAAGLNPMLSHSAWSVRGVRFDNSYQPNAPVEIGSDMINDSPEYGKLSGGSNTPESEKKYPQNADTEAGTYWEFGNDGLDNVYGGYGQKPHTPTITYDPTEDPYSPEYLYAAVSNVVIQAVDSNTSYKLRISNGNVAAIVYVPLANTTPTQVNGSPTTSIMFSDPENDSDYKLQIYGGAIHIDPVKKDYGNFDNLESLLNGLPPDQLMRIN